MPFLGTLKEPRNRWFSICEITPEIPVWNIPDCPRESGLKAQRVGTDAYYKYAKVHETQISIPTNESFS